MRSTMAMIALAGALLAPSATAFAEDCPSSTPEQVDAIGRAYFDAFNAGSVTALDRLLAPDYRHQGAVVSEQDRARHLLRLGAVRTGFPDGRYTIEWTFVDGDVVVIRHRFAGTHEGSFNGVPASNNKVAVGAFHVHRIACGRIAETWNAGDGIGLFRQMGAIPGPETTVADKEPAGPSADTAAASCIATDRDANIAMARRWYEEALNQGRFEVLDKFVADDVVHHAAVFSDTVGREASKQNLAAIRAAFPDIVYTVDAAYASDDKVLVRWTGRGTHSGPPFMGVATSGKPVDWSGMNAFRFACGKMVEGWSEANGLHVLRQLGAKVP